jgi:phosphoglycerate kinase
MQCITSVPRETFTNKRVLVRADLNVPVKDNMVTDDLRIRRLLPTLTYLADCGAKIIILSHFGRAGDTLTVPFRKLQVSVPTLEFERGLPGDAGVLERVSALQPGKALLLENLRKDDREEKNDPAFAKAISELGDIYVNEAFSNSHRAHASMVGVPALLPHYVGISLQEEVDHLTKALQPEHPSLAIVAGAKFDTKEPLIRILLQKYKTVFVGGALANDLLKARGHAVGASLVSEGGIPDELTHNPRLLAPRDVLVERRVTGKDGGTGFTEQQANIDAVGTKAVIAQLDEVLPDDVIVDIGPRTLQMLNEEARRSAHIVWNGPLGWYEKGYTAGSRAFALSISQSNAVSILGGGDTVAAIETADFNPETHCTFVSAGGGAMLDFMMDGELVALKALE